MPDVIVIAGPNGAGKSTFAPDLLDKCFPGVPFINADSIAEELNAAGNGSEIEAGRITLRRLRDLAEAKESFAFETTLSARSYYRFLEARQQADAYSVQITYLWLPDVELSVARVAERVRLGGHDIPESVIRRRFDRGRENFFQLYLPLADAWRLYDASADKPQLIASGDKMEGDSIVNKNLWQEVMTKERQA